MKNDHLKILMKELIRSVLIESIYTLNWYHGSPYCCMQSITEYEGQMMFLTDSLAVAKDYTRSNPGLMAGKKPSNKIAIQPTIYRIALKLAQGQIFDFRKPEHKKLFREFSKTYSLDDPDGMIRKSDFVYVHPAHGSHIGGVFPSFGITYAVIDFMNEHGFQASYFAEGTQGASLCVINPQENLEIVEILN